MKVSSHHTKILNDIRKYLYSLNAISFCFPSSQRKAKKQILSALCGSAVNIKENHH